MMTFRIETCQFGLELGSFILDVRRRSLGGPFDDNVHIVLFFRRRRQR